MAYKRCKQQRIDKVDKYLKGHKSSFKWKIVIPQNSKTTIVVEKLKKNVKTLTRNMLGL